MVDGVLLYVMNEAFIDSKGTNYHQLLRLARIFIGLARPFTRCRLAARRTMLMLGAVCAPRCHLAQCDERASPSHPARLSNLRAEHRNSHQPHSRAPFTHRVQHGWTDGRIAPPIFWSFARNFFAPVSACQLWYQWNTLYVISTVIPKTKAGKNPPVSPEGKQHLLWFWIYIVHLKAHWPCDTGK